MISLVVPTYNSVNTIKDCLDSILKLTHIRYEIILVDDGSIDGTYHINNVYAKKYPEIISLRQNHKGVSEARNLGINYSSGSWISFIDSDDTINAAHLEKIYKLYAKPYNDIIFSDFKVYGRKIGIHNEDKKLTVNEFVRENYPLIGFAIADNAGKIYNLRTIRKYNLCYISNMNYGEDFAFTLNFVKHADNYIIQTHIYYYNYIIHSKSTVRSYDKFRLKNELIILNMIESLYRYFNLSFKALCLIKLKISLNILMNEVLYNPIRNKIESVSLAKKQIYKYKLLPRKFRYKRIKCCIIKFIIRLPKHLLLFYLYIVIFRMRLANVVKHYLSKY